MRSYRTAPQPHIFRLDSSVGTCSTNEKKEVKKLQLMLEAAGYTLSTGRPLPVTGHCSTDTIEAIRWYQSLLKMSPTGLVQPTDIWFMEAMQNASRTEWRPKHSGGILTVKEGQLTFDYEGVDYITAVEPFRQPARMPWFSRILHHPTNDSGVTLGRGFDMKKRSAGEILSMLRQAGIKEYKAQLCALASHLSGREADIFIEVYGPLVGEISHYQQVRLFELSYAETVSYAKHLYLKFSAKVPSPVSWNNIEQKIKDTFVDTLFQGNVTASEMVAIIAKNGSKQDVITYLNNDIYQKKDPRRLTLRLSYLK